VRLFPSQLRQLLIILLWRGVVAVDQVGQVGVVLVGIAQAPELAAAARRLKLLLA
jgi:hypothetical protein